MTRKERKQNSHDESNIERLVSLLGLLFGYLEYILNLRPALEKLGLYALGFTDCFVLILSVILIFRCYKSLGEESTNLR